MIKTKKPTGFSVHGWRTGTVIRRHHGSTYTEGVVQDNGEYQVTSHSGLWVFQVLWTGADRATHTHPFTTDEIVKR